MDRVVAALAVALVVAGCGNGGGQPAVTRTTHLSLTEIDVTGMSIAAAEKKLQAVGWIPTNDQPQKAYGDYGGSYNLVPEDPDWIVCSQHFTTLVDGTRDLYLDAAPTCGETTMPNLVGKTHGEASEVADELGLLLLEETASGLGNVGSRWIVCGHEPAAGQFARDKVDTLLVYVEPPGAC